MQEGDGNDDVSFGDFGDFQHEETIKDHTGSKSEYVCPIDSQYRSSNGSYVYNYGY